MMKSSDVVTPVQLAVTIISTMIGVSLLGIPNFVTEKVGTAAPLSSVLGVLMGGLGILAITLLGRRFPKQTLIGYNQKILGKKLGNFFSIVIILFFLILMGVETRHFAEVIVGSLLPDTPISISIFFMIFLCASISFLSVSTFVYIHFFYLPFIIIPLLIILLPSIKNITFYHLFPITGHDVSIGMLFSGGMNVTQAISNFMVIAMLIPFMKNPKKCVKSGIWGYVIGSLFFIMTITIALAVFGPEEMKHLLWPTLILGQMVQIPGDVLSRVDAILLIAWIFAVFTTLFSYYFLYVRGVAELVRSSKYRLISSLGFPFVFIVALLPKDIYEVYYYVLEVTLGGLILTIIYPMCLLILAIIRKQRGIAE
ncbi:GerAB/ArcD/ProY family transporter [Lysinibacillus sp. 3P01SB]|uniref:GerAB/ArcD/ProY family transporter n=1 Tax=Lysinibacillus sp. 3P01SB TaxID=3132284 RepID=UPI0039A439E3